jgi:presenilin-like A22 family membrane protease
MKHRPIIPFLLLTIFLVTQFIGIFVVNAYSPEKIIDPSTGEETIAPGNQLPFGLQNQEEDPTPSFFYLIFSFALAFALIFILMKYKWKIIIKLWFLFVVTLALTISINAILQYTSIKDIQTIAIAIAIPLAIFKIFKPNVYIHNLTELLIYPGIAAVFVSILTWKSIIALLILISIYDAWAVWKSGVMQKMAKFQMEELKIFGGFLIPSVSKKVKEEIKKIKQKYKKKKIPERLKKKKFKVNMAILGGGDVIFPIITSGVFMEAYGIIPALFIIAGAFLGLSSIFLISKKEKAYPAMPFITTGIFATLLIWRLFFY